MSDDTPWKPPAPGGNEPRLPDPTSTPDSPLESADSTPEPTLPTLPTLPPATPPTAEPSPWAQAPDAAALGGTPPPVEPTITAASNGGGRGRGKRALAIGTVAVVAVGLGGIFAVRGLTGETAGGAASPEDLGEQFLDSVEGEDVLGLVDMLLPGERDTLGQPFIDTMSELQRLEVLSTDFDLSQLAGVDVQLAQRSVEVESTNVDDIVQVALSADVTVSVDGAAIPIGDLIEDNIPDDTLTELRGSKMTETDSIEFDLTAVRDDGRWYFSVWYSVAEMARAELDDADIPLSGVGAVGAETPEAALDRFVSQIETLDLTGLIQSLDPYEAAALQRYAPLFLDEAEAALADVPATIEITDFEFRLEGDGASRTAFPESFALVVTEEDGTSVTVTYDGSCFRAVSEFPEMGPDEFEFCGDQLDLAEEMAGVEIDPEVQELAEVVAAAFADMEPAGVELRERDGQWYFSPISTMTEAWLKVLRALDRDELDQIVAAAPPAFEALNNAFFGTYDEDWIGEDWVEEEWEESSDDWTDGAHPGTITDEPMPEPTPIDECYTMNDAAEAMACFDALLAAGAAEPWEVPVVLRHPECGLAELSWSGELYALGDAEFTEALTAARPCFEDLVAAGALEEWEVPFEVSNLDCFEGRNWYNVFDDAEYDARVSECTGT